MHSNIAYTCIAIMFFGTIATDALNMCTFKAPRDDIDWDRVGGISWNWASHTFDDWQESLGCSKVAMHGIGKGPNSTFTMDMAYGTSPHQRYSFTGKYVNTSEYHMEDFEFSWRNVVAFLGDVRPRQFATQGKDSLPRKGNAIFYTDYRNYFITAICLPTGRVSVMALTPHQRSTRLLMKRIYGVLGQYKVLAIPTRINCRLVNNNNKISRDR